MNYRKHRKPLYVLELIVYLVAIGIIFWIDWRYGVATVMMVIADNMKTRRMMAEKPVDNVKPF
jgi:hypothetical protein